MLLLSPRFFHSSFIHSTGTSGLPFCTAPQQHPRQSATCATKTRFVCKEKVMDATILAPSPRKYSSPCRPSPSDRREAAAMFIFISAAGAEKDEVLRLLHQAI